MPIMRTGLSNIKYAELLGITKQAVGQGIKNSLIIRGKSGIDPKHPVNVVYAARVAEKKRKTRSKRNKSAVKIQKTERKIETLEEIRATANPDASIFDIDDRKKIEETRYRKIKADEAALEYAVKLGAMVDDVALHKKFGEFWNCLLIDFIYLPESLADLIVNEVKSADDPVNAVTDILKKAIGDAIKKAKTVARKIKAPKKKRKYVLEKIKK